MGTSAHEDRPAQGRRKGICMPRSRIPPAGVRPGFTLVELLVVIGIIALLITILLPAMTRAREQANRVACSSNVRSFCQALIMIAQDNKGQFPDLVNSDGQYDSTGYGTQRYPYEIQVMHPYVRDVVMPRYGMSRKMFYCPSNPEMNVDVNWIKPDKSNFAFVGYMILAGQTRLGVTRSEFAASGGSKGGFEEVPADQRLFALRQGQKAFYQVLAADTTRTWQNNLNPSSHVRGITSDGLMPRGRGGANVGYIDGHVDWRPQDLLGQSADAHRRKRQYWYNDLRFWW
jgi:prepilin-type N-terminal cleavage/methylation domain-containing protein/prepilin-type processing-associated H-X9-DG protein